MSNAINKYILRKLAKTVPFPEYQPDISDTDIKIETFYIADTKGINLARAFRTNISQGAKTINTVHWVAQKDLNKWVLVKDSLKAEEADTSEWGSSELGTVKELKQDLLKYEIPRVLAGLNNLK